MYRVMIVDDEHMIHLSLRKLMESSGLGLTVAGEAEDGAEALAMLDECSPDIVVTDIRMPEMDGLSFIEAAQAKRSGIRFIILSGYDEFEYARRALRYGVSDFLLKPVDPEQFTQTLRRVCEQLASSEKDFRDRHRRFLALQPLARELAGHIWSAAEDKAAGTLEAIVKRLAADAHNSEDSGAYAQSVIAAVEAALEERNFRFERARGAGADWPADAEGAADRLRQAVSAMIREIRASRNLGAGHYIRRAVRYMEEHYTREELSLTEVAHALGISVPYLSRSFKEEMNVTFVQHLTRLRMAKARELLADTDNSTTEIALQVGYSDYPHFSKTFKKMYGLTPTAYRKQLRSGQAYRGPE
ncbi:helix-turn-helix domain-containing protein [Paenibacillus cisolokensis]|uniref:response regulator transcription factor n=1 Tax=Paenibacillus cisolokensis TaxID=1658519 RepID=UPI003D2ACDEE